MFLEHPMISAPSLECFGNEGASLFSESGTEGTGSWRPLPDTLPANGEISKTRVWRAAIVAARRMRAHRVAVCSPSTHRSTFESQRDLRRAAGTSNFVPTLQSVDKKITFGRQGSSRKGRPRGAPAIHLQQNAKDTVKKQ